MSWSSLLLFAVGLFAGFKCLGYSQKNDSLKFLGLTLASFLFVIIQLSLVIDSFTQSNLSYTGYIVEWGHVLSLSFILSSLAIFIRQSKPVFAQFPLLYAGLPFLIVLSYFLVRDTYALKDWLLSIYQGGAILVALLMYSVYTYRDNKYGVILAGTFLFMITFLIFWYIPVIRESYAWIWKLSLAASIGLTIYGYEYVHQYSVDIEPSLHKNL